MLNFFELMPIKLSRVAEGWMVCFAIAWRQPTAKRALAKRNEKRQ